MSETKPQTAGTTAPAALLAQEGEVERHRRERKEKWLGYATIALEGLLSLLLLVSLLLVILGVVSNPNALKGTWLSIPGEAFLHLQARGFSPSHLFVTLVVEAGLIALFLSRNKQGLRVVFGLVLAGLVVISAGGSLLDPKVLWGWVLAALPALMVVHHGLYLGLMKPRFITDEHRAQMATVSHLKELVEANDRYYSPSNIALRYGLPAMAIFAIGAAVFHYLNPVTDWALGTTLRNETGGVWIVETTLVAARFGAAGAYVYVLLYLGQRGFRHDITSGSALWCAVTLALGPLFAGVFAKIWMGPQPPDAALPAGWTTQALYFLVGLSPRHIARLMEQLVRRLTQEPGKAMPADRTMPLILIRGITPPVEERLIEEGVFDVAGLAKADPLRLHRNTNFDKHQILAWIDSALLMHALPESWDELEPRGVRGATDLSWYARLDEKKAAVSLQALAREPLTVELLRDAAQRLDVDVQVERIRMLRQLGVHELGERGTPPTTPPALASPDPLRTAIEGLTATLQHAATRLPTQPPAAPAPAPQPDTASAAQPGTAPAAPGTVERTE
jgi:hypothetical protein